MYLAHDTRRYFCRYATVFYTSTITFVYVEGLYLACSLALSGGREGGSWSHPPFSVCCRPVPLKNELGPYFGDEWQKLPSASVKHISEPDPRVLVRNEQEKNVLQHTLRASPPVSSSSRKSLKL